MNIRKLLAVPFVFALTFGVVGCGDDYDHTVIENVKGGSINMQRLEIAEGGITKARLAVFDDDNELMKLAIRSTDSNVVEVQRIITDYDYAFVGLRTGRAQIQLVADDVVVHTIEAEVVAQKALP